MPDLHQRIASFRGNVFPRQAELYRRLAQDGQQPQALMISCAGSRVMPETIASPARANCSSAAMPAIPCRGFPT